MNKIKDTDGNGGAGFNIKSKIVKYRNIYSIKGALIKSVTCAWKYDYEIQAIIQLFTINVLQANLPPSLQNC